MEGRKPIETEHMENLNGRVDKLGSIDSKEGRGYKLAIILLLILLVGLISIVIAFLIGEGRHADLHVENLTPEVNVAAPINFEEMKSSFALLGDKVVEAERLRIDFEKQRMDGEQKKIEIRLIDEEEKATRYARNAIFYINHINMVLSKILTYNNPAVLEEEYNAISLNSIRLDTIKDEEVIDIIQEIMDYITEMRLQERQRAMLKEELDRGMSDALIDSFKGVNTGSAISPIGMAVNLVSSAASAGMSYRNVIKKLKHEHGKELWKLDNEKIKELNELNKSLLRSYWRIVQRYGLDDRYRVTEEQINRLFARLKDDNPDRRYRFLKQNEEAYMALPIYWFYRGEAAHGEKQFDDALYAFNKYQDSQRGEDEFVYDPVTNVNMRACGKILRRDPTAAKAAMLLSDTLLQLSGPKKKLENDTLATLARQVKLIMENTLDDEWSLRYYAACLCGCELKDFDGAKNILQQTIDELESRRDSNLISWADDHHGVSMTTNSDERIVAPGDALMRCKQLAMQLEVESVLGQDRASDRYQSERDKLMRELCEREGTSAREKLFLYGAMRYKDALKYLEKDITNIKAKVEHDGSVAVDFPMSWIINQEGEMSIYLPKTESQISYKEGKPYYGDGGVRAPVKEVSRKIIREVPGDPSSPYMCEVVFGAKETSFLQHAHAVLLVMNYDITDRAKADERRTRIVLEYKMPNDGKMGKLDLKKAALGPYRASNTMGEWVEDCSIIEFPKK